MMLLLLLASASAELDALDKAVARCDRAASTPAFASESERRSQFQLDAYKEQEAIVAARLDLSQHRRELREAAAPKTSAEEQNLALEDALIQDRQRALNDKRMLEGLRRDAMDAMRRHFLAHCASGKGKK
jgi:hypothetical protein